MTDQERLQGTLGLCVRAGQAVFGEGGCLKALRSGESGLLLLERSASANTRDRYTRVCAYSTAELWLVEDELIRSATGRPGVAMAIRNGKMTELVLQRLRQVPESAEKVNLTANNGGGVSVEWRR